MKKIIITFISLIIGILSRAQTVNEHYYFRFSSVGFNRLKNKLLAEYLRNRGNELATVQISAICGAMLSNMSM